MNARASGAAQTFADFTRRAPNLAALRLTYDAIRRELRHRTLWTPFADRDDGSAHPQRLALESKADILGYGGQAGGGKSDLLLGAARFHHRSIVFRRTYPSLTALVDRSRQIYNPEGDAAQADRYNESLHRWRFDTGGILYFDSLQYDKDALGHQGQPKDYYGFDELTEFSEYQFRFVTGWNRTTKTNQRCRVIATMNPPTTEEGRWVVRFFAPWIDPDYSGVRAKAGELRWFTTVTGRDLEVADNRPFVLGADLGGGRFELVYDYDAKTTDPTRVLYPKSRTFVFASVRDNPILLKSGYVATLQALPEPLRSIMLNGDFSAGMGEDPWRVIPREWVLAAQRRWEANRDTPRVAMTQLGVDVARSEASAGGDRTVLTPRYGHRLETQVIAKTADGPKVVQHIILVGPGDALVTIDVVGVGSSPVDFAKPSFKVYAFNGAEKSERTSKQGNLHFFNKRSSAYWHFRECLDPASGLDMELPPDPELLADLTAFKWELTPRGIKVESKDDGTTTSVVRRLGRSPDKGDSAVYSLAPNEAKGMALFDLMSEEYTAHQAGAAVVPPPAQFDWHSKA